tara:strand:- start:2337 stop:2972 length:636 start_codon:yes stop_codon:yes gene_type:complete
MSAMDAASVQKVYSRWARVYDWVFGLLFGNARRLAFQRMELKSGNYAIEVGVGTGLSLTSLPEGCHLVGVDFSRPMLERALMRWRADSVDRTAVLVEGDGACLPFPDKTFDAAFAAFVVSATPDAVALLEDMQRVCRPGARMVVVNHFSPNEPRLARLRSSFSNVTSRLLGFHAEFPLEPLFRKAGIEVDRIERATFCGGWRVVTFIRRES